MRIYIISKLFFLYSLGFAQSENVNYFNAQVLGEKVVLNFELRAGSICNGISIERRPENQNFNPIGSISGVCGSENNPESYYFTDEQPLKNQRIYYRLSLGGLGVSHEIEVFVPDLSVQNYAIAIEPNSQKLALYFSNWTGEKVKIRFFTPNGQLIFETETFNNFVNLPEFDGNFQFMAFQITASESEAIVSGKIVIH